MLMVVVTVVCGVSEKGRENERELELTGDRTSETSWRTGANATLVVNDLRDFGAI